MGTVVKTESGRLLGSLEKHGEIFVAARGGAGGKGNHFFLSNENRAPAKAELGAKGQEMRLRVELRTMAHAGLVSSHHNSFSSLHFRLPLLRSSFLSCSCLRVVPF